MSQDSLKPRTISLSFRMKIILGAVACLIVAAITMMITHFSAVGTVEASTPPTSNVTVPSTTGQTVTVNWTGTIPPLTNASSNCAALADTPAVDQHNSTVAVPLGIYNTLNAQFTFKITWTPVVNINTSDEILTVVGSGGSSVGSSDGGTNTETVAAKNLSADTYKIIACGFANAQPQPYSGTLTITTAASVTTPPNYTTGAMTFGPSNVVDFQRTEGEPLLHLDKDGNYWETGPWGFSTTQSFIHRSVDGGDQFNVVSPTALRPNSPPGGGDSTIAIDDQGFTYFGDLEGALEQLDCSVSNDNGNNWKKNPACARGPADLPLTGTDRQWLAVDNGSNHTVGAAGAADNTVFYAFHGVGTGHWILSSPGSTGTADLMGGLVFTNSNVNTTDPAYTGGGNCGELVFDPVNRNLYYPCQAGNHVEVIVGHVNPIQRTGITFMTHVLPNSPGGSVSNLFPPLSVDSAGNVYVVWSDPGDHNLYYAYSTDQGNTWQPTVKVNAPPAKSNVFAWAEAGSAGNLVAVWLGNDSSTLSDNMPNFGANPSGATAFPWFGYVALIRNANTPSPTFEQNRFTEKPMHYGQICNGGIGCTLSSGDRVMADFLSVDLASDGAIQIIFNDVSSQYHGAHLFLARQLTGPTPIGTTLSKPTPVSPVFDPTGDAQVPHYSPIGAGANLPQLDLTSVAVNQTAPDKLRVRMTLNSLSSLLPPTGKANAFWITRFQALSRDDTNTTDVYRVFYVGAESIGGAPPIFFAGSPTRDGPPAGCTTTTPGNCKVMQYPAEISSLTSPMVNGSISGNTICIDLGLNAFLPNRPIGNTLYNVTAFSGGRDNVAADVYAEGDSTRSFDFTLGTISAAACAAPTPAPTPTPNPLPCSGTTVEDDDSHIAYSNGWHLINNSNASAGHFRLNESGNNKHNAVLSFHSDATQTSITYFYATSPKGGSAEVFLDNQDMGPVSYHGSAGSNRSPVFGASASKSFPITMGDHTLEIRPIKDAVYIDGFCIDGIATLSGTPAAHPGNTSESLATQSAGQALLTSITLPAGTQAISIAAEPSVAVPIQLVLINPSGTVVQTVNSSSGVAILEAPITQSGVYIIKTVNLSLGPVQIWSVATPLVSTSLVSRISNGPTTGPKERSPQAGPLWPVLSNILVEVCEQVLTWYG